MAGVVAMASIIEDFDTQPCKKSHKDGDSPVVKTITSYFSPVSKPVEKPFSPPRANNIMDYFIRKAPSKTSSPEQLKENCQKSPLDEKRSRSEAAVKQPSQKRSRKASKSARKLVEAETISSTEDDSCLIVEQAHDNRESAADADMSCYVLSSNTTAPLVRLHPELCIMAGQSERNAIKTVSEKDDHHKESSKYGNNVRLKPELNSIELSPIMPSKDKAKQVKTIARNSRNKQQQEATQSDPEEREFESSLCNVSMDVNLDEVSQLNSSTVTISFEEFLRSQSQDRGDEDVQDEQGTKDERKITSEEEKMDNDHLEIPKAEENVCSAGPVPRVSPRTVTIQAEVHVVSPKQEPMVVGKLASIFTRRKGTMSPAEAVSSPHTEAGHQSPSTSLTVKCKSNVVLHEDELELAVIESESTPKCSEAERKQFMAAFKQVSLDGSKTKPGKNPGKQKQSGEKVLDDEDKVAEENTIIPPSNEQVPTASQDNKVAKKKPARKGRNKAKEEKETGTPPPAAAPVEEIVTMTVDVDDKREGPSITSSPSIPAVRRSRREAVIRKTPKATPAAPIRKTRQHDESENTAATLPSPAKTRKSKHGVFVAEMVCLPDTKQSPIRIKFIRVHKHVAMTEQSECGINTTKTSNDSKKRKRAEKLVEKAREIQQSKKAAVEKGILRRSCRTEASTKKNYGEDEDSVVCLEDETAIPQTAPEKFKTQKSLRSLNDVLGKASSVGKETRPVPGSKVASLGQEKTARKVSAVISIFDESSHEGSENSQDDEQFRTRREFLKSGLPESFRKQIAKTAATKEAYSLSCSSFQPVTHMKQPPKDCPLWSLSWPQSPLLCHLQELWCQTSDPLPSVGGSLCVKTEPVHRAFYEQDSGWRPEISESVRELLTEEVSTYNPLFPVKMVITRFLKRRTNHQQQCTATEAITSVASTTLSAEPVRGKRKRMDDEGEMTVKETKKQRAESSKERVSTAKSESPNRGGRTRRAQRSRPEEETNEKTERAVKAPPIQSEDVVVLLGEEAEKKVHSPDMVKEDMLWTDKYQPQHSSDIVGNAVSVRRLHGWLKEWKLRADREERKKQTDKKQEEGSDDSDWGCGEEDSQDGEDMLCNTVLITGPPGVGKTAAVYACAQELGFKVFEVNASSQRSGRLILSQLKEATQSHQVDSQGVNAHKPTYFNSYGTNSSTGPLRPGSSPRKVNSPRRAYYSPRKHPQSPRGAKRGGLAPTSLANFFKIGPPTNSETLNTKKKEQTAAAKNLRKASECASKPKDPAVNSPTATTPKEKNNEEQSKKTATSLILFEEVDVIFDDDSGFLAAIKTFMSTTKRPVILTTNDPAFSTMFDGNFEEIHFKAPSVLEATSFLRLACLAEDIRTDQRDISSLLRLNRCDIRQSLLQLQLWSRSGGGRCTTRPLSYTDKNAGEPETEDALCATTVPSALPPCETGCTEGMLGLLNIAPKRDVWELLRCRHQSCSPEEALCWELLTNSRQRGVDLLYSNMEKLLPLPVTQLISSTYKPEQSLSVSQAHPSFNPNELPSTCLQVDMLPSHAGLLHPAESADCSDEDSPVKVSNRKRKNKRQHCVHDQEGLHSDSDSDDGFLSLYVPQSTPQAKEGVIKSFISETVKRKPLTPEERLRSLPVTQCLESLADFLDNMSYMDFSSSTLEGGDGHSGMLPVGALLKDGMTDASRVEVDRGSLMRGEHAFEIPAAVEALSFHKCGVSVAGAWEKAQQLEGDLRKEAAAQLTLPVAAHRDCYGFTQDGPCQSQLVQQRREVMESLMSRGVLGSLCSRPAASLDYLPALRAICRSEQLKEQGKVKRRFLHYLDAIHLGLEKNTLQRLAEDFP